MCSKNFFYVNGYVMLILMIFCYGCYHSTHSTSKRAIVENNWKATLQQELPLLGDRNWILVVDKAFPALNARGIRVIYANENLLEVLRYTFNKIDSSSHVRPIIYVDKEMQYITPQIEQGIIAYKDSIKAIVNNQFLHPELHDSVFRNIQKISSLFKVLVIKTNETRAYSSVYLQLDCAYWNADKENQLRQTMSQK